MRASELVEMGRAFAFRRVVDVVFTAAVGASHLEAARNRVSNRLDVWFGGDDRGRCPRRGCTGWLMDDHRPSARFTWLRCTECGRAQVGVQAGEAA